MSGTFKVYLTAEQWARVCDHDEEVKSEVAKQQPELLAAMKQPTKENPSGPRSYHAERRSSE